MTECIETVKKDSKVQNEISQAIEKKIKNKESCAIQSKQGQIALIESKVFEQALTLMGDTMEDMDIEIEQEDNKIEFLRNKLGLPDCKVLEEMNRLGLNKNHLKEKVIGLWIG